MKNDTPDGLGVPLPAGSTALYAQRPGGRLLLGLGAVTDRTVGETIRLAAGVSSQVTLTQAMVASAALAAASGAAISREVVLTATNANPFPATLDVPIGAAGQAIEADDKALNRTDGTLTWSPTLPPGGRADLRYRY
ncbi:hypothetical protein H5J25_03775 [Sphingomonas aliaeris]|uniref:DUF4139 domain-containing protein n=1 Tax=Sphingomonas aliaeris TaxID=2759526 RepID=A0A974NVX6_9SPHN|nr:hypothetical protein [Sphingomonas aliaeris]QQV77881.1 hypothetical protein H5J25_03775 [Sphingomonas aliaeris]